MPYNKYAVSFIASIMSLPAYVKWLVFSSINLIGLVQIVFIYRKARKQIEKGAELEMAVLIMAAKILFQILATGILCTLFSILADMQALREVESAYVPLLTLSLFLFDMAGKESMMKRVLGGKEE